MKNIIYIIVYTFVVTTRIIPSEPDPKKANEILSNDIGYYYAHPQEALNLLGVHLDDVSIKNSLLTGSRDVKIFSAKYITDKKITILIPALRQAMKGDASEEMRIEFAFALAQLDDKDGFDELRNICVNSRTHNIAAAGHIGYLNLSNDLDDEKCFDSVYNTFMNPLSNYLDIAVRQIGYNFKTKFKNDHLLYLAKKQLVIYMNHRRSSVRINAYHSYIELTRIDLQNKLNDALKTEEDAHNRDVIDNVIRNINKNGVDWLTMPPSTGSRLESCTSEK